MLRILRDKFVRLGRDDDGMAMVVTLAVFMFMWLVCMGVYAIGTAVKTRIHLQNACDAAAYSAAVVQADTLSRIATLNRAMSWTYAQMTRRQMDLIVWKWLKHARYHYNQDKANAIAWYASGTLCPKHSWWNVWAYNPIAGDHLQLTTAPIISGNKAKSTDNMTLNDHYLPDFPNYPTGVVPNTLIDAEISLFLLHDTGNTFYANASPIVLSKEILEWQIREDKMAISQINAAERSLARNLKNQVELAVNQILKANMADRQDYKYAIRQSLNPLEAEYADSVGKYCDGYLTHLTNSDSDERRFLSFHNRSFLDGRTITDEFKRGINKWFVYGDGESSTKDKYDIQRAYLKGAKGPLMAKWNWCASKSTCIPPTPFSPWIHLLSVPKTSCGHSHTQDRCKNTQSLPDPNGGSPGLIECMTATSFGNNEEDGSPVVWTELSHVGEMAKPLVLRENFFDRAGTITVCLACENKNPWEILFGRAAGGIFSAFKISNFVKWTVCFASAKAGYKYLDDDNASRAYRIDWKEVSWTSPGQSWNLCQSDWDAVLIPVRRAESLASDGSWQDGVGDFLEDYAEGGIGVSRNDMLAGGTKNMARPEWKDGRGRDLPPDYYRFDRWRGLPEGRTWDWARNGVTAQWQIGNKNAPIDWAGIQKVMFH